MIIIMISLNNPYKKGRCDLLAPSIEGARGCMISPRALARRPIGRTRRDRVGRFRLVPTSGSRDGSCASQCSPVEAEEAPCITIERRADEGPVLRRSLRSLPLASPTMPAHMGSDTMSERLGRRLGLPGNCRLCASAVPVGLLSRPSDRAELALDGDGNLT